MSLKFIRKHGRPVVVYDGGCGMCKGNVKWLARLDWLGVFEAMPYQDPRMYDLFPRLDPKRCEQEMHLAFPDGRVFAGADALRQVLLRLPAAAPLGLILSIPPLPWVLRRLYPVLARNRHRLGGRCPIKPPEEAGPRPLEK